MAQIFISYARHNKNYVKNLAEKLLSFGYSIFYDANIDAGERYRERLSSELKDAKVVLGIWDKETMKSTWVIDECARAASEEKVVPVLIGALDSKALPLELSTIHCLDLEDDEGEDFGSLIRAINRHLAPDKLRQEFADQDRGVNLQPLISESTTAESTNVAVIIEDLNNDLIKRPDYQRESNQWDLKTKSLFIESVINNLAIPAFFFEPSIQAGKEINYIVDGQQRLTTLLDYSSGNFALLPAGEVPYISPNLNHYEGRKFGELPQVYQQAFRRYRLTIIKLRDLGEQRLEVFRRINHGGTPLSPQDIRLAYYGERSKSVAFIRLTGNLTPDAPATRAVLDNVRERWNIAHPWDDQDAFGKWKGFWSDQHSAIGQKASEMFLWCLISANLDQLQSTISRKKDYSTVKDLEVRTVEDVLDLYCAQLAHQEPESEPEVLFNFERISTEVFPVFQSVVKNLIDRKHIVTAKSRQVGICAGALFHLGIDPAGVKAGFWPAVAEFIWASRPAAEKYGVKWQENKGRWDGPKSWASQIRATHKVINKISL